jgi:hypothetical protein
MVSSLLGFDERENFTLMEVELKAKHLLEST